MKWRKGSPSAPVEEKPKGFDDFELRLGDLMRGERATMAKSLLDVQREIKIKATYIAAIENADLSVFETQGFVAGYVRSYARYLGMDPEWAYTKFCVEAGYEAASGLGNSTFSGRVPSGRPAPRVRPRHVGDPLGDPNAAFVPRGPGLLSQVEPAAVGSILVLIVLIAGIGYGGWSVLREVQRVQVTPIDEAPRVVAEIDPLGNVGGTGVAQLPAVVPADIATADALGQLYRPQALDAPVLVARDGPIATIVPRRGEFQLAEAAPEDDDAPTEMPVQVVASPRPPVQIFAVRPTCVRVQAADGTVLFEKTLNAGERYTVPQGDAPARLRAGNSGSLYFAVNGETYGPAAPGSQVVRNVALSPEALRSSYALADLTRDPDLARVVAVAEAGR